MLIFESFNQFIEVQVEDFDACIDVLEHDFVLDDVVGNIRLHHLKTDGNGRPMVKALAETLYTYIVNYCIAAKNRDGSLTARQYTKLTKDARGLFRHPSTDESDDKTGEAGEALLFFLTEAVLKAPQLVAKMELKTNHADEVKGSDGIHAKWNEEDKIIEIYFGESKLYQNVNSAIKSALKSIGDFHKNEMYKHEFSMVTKHFKYADEEVKKEVSNLLRGGEPGESVRLNHACLIGFDWGEYKKISPLVLRKVIKEKLLEDGTAIVEKINQGFSEFEHKYLSFEIFILPFPSVSEFRNAFNAALD
jgi:hypothetical protein